MFLALMGYLILVPIVVDEAGDSIVNLNYLGSRGAFMAFIVALVTTKIHIAVVNRGFTIKMPAGVPDSVGKTFTAIIPGLFCAVVMGALRFAFSLTSYGNVIDAVYSWLQAPLAGVTGSLPGFIILIIVANLLWFVGVHGSYTVLPILFPIWFSYLPENMAAAAAGEAIPHIWNISMYDFACNGGCGCTLGLVIVMALFAKSQRYKQFSKVVLPVGLFNINEPVVFGLPLMYNFTFLIPFLLGFLMFFFLPLVNTVIYSFNHITVDDAGAMLLNPVGVQNYIDLFTTEVSTKSQQILRVLVDENSNMLVNMPLITLFSLFLALLANRKFKGRAVVRMIFFLPIILGLEVVTDMLTVTTGSDWVAAGGGLFAQSLVARMLIRYTAIPTMYLTQLIEFVENIFSIISIPILFASSGETVSVLAKD
jgi:lactose/cellobiose-specific phosphotransferase system IIC component